LLVAGKVAVEALVSSQTHFLIYDFLEYDNHFLTIYVFKIKDSIIRPTSIAFFASSKSSKSSVNQQNSKEARIHTK
jgi:hypothetical protein